MASYGTNAEVQKLAFKTTNSDWDSASTSARDVATSIINAELDRTTDLSTVSDLVTRCANLLAAGIVSSSPTNIQENVFWQQGQILLKSLRGDDTDDASWGRTIAIERFGGYEPYPHDVIW